MRWFTPCYRRPGSDRVLVSDQPSPGSDAHFHGGRRCKHGVFCPGTGRSRCVPWHSGSPGVSGRRRRQPSLPVVLMAILRDLVRVEFLKPVFHPGDLKVVAQYSPMIGFSYPLLSWAWDLWLTCSIWPQTVERRPNELSGLGADDVWRRILDRPGRRRACLRGAFCRGRRPFSGPLRNERLPGKVLGRSWPTPASTPNSFYC